MLCIKITARWEILKPWTDVILEVKTPSNKAAMYTTAGFVSPDVCARHSKGKEKTEMGNSKLRRRFFGSLFFFFFVLRNFVKNFTEIELHPPNIWFSLMLLLPTEDGPVQNFPPALLRTCLGSAAHVDAEPALRNLRTNAGRAWTSNRDPRRKHY